MRSAVSAADPEYVRRSCRFDGLDTFAHDLVVAFTVPDKERLHENAALALKSVRVAESTAQTQQGATIGRGAFAKKNIDTSQVVAPISVVHVDVSLAHSERFEKAFGTSYCLAERKTAYRGTVVMMTNTPAMFVNDPKGLTVGGLPASANCTLNSMGLGIFAVYASRPITTVR